MNFVKGFIKIFLIMLISFSPSMLFAEDKGVAKLTYGDDSWIALHFLLQAQFYAASEYDSPSQSESDAVWTKNFQLRRSRIILNGQVTKNVEFFMQTDDVLVGSQGNGSQYSTNENTNTSGTTSKDKKGTYTQDAFINYRLANEFEIAAGLICLPFMHHSRESAASQLGIDYNSAVIPLTGNSNEWRDTGVEIRGIFRRAVDYRIGIFNGQKRDRNDPSTKNDDINTHSYPRYCGRLQINFADPETGFFYSGNYLGKKNVLAIGGAIDFQNHASRINGNYGYYMAWTGDATIDYKLDEDIVVALQGGYVSVKNKPEASVSRQYGYFAQLGFLIGKIQPVVKYQYWDGDVIYSNVNASDKKISYLTFGLNYFIDGHRANIKAEYQSPMGPDNKSISGEKKGTIQAQIFI